MSRRTGRAADVLLDRARARSACGAGWSTRITATAAIADRDPLRLQRALDVEREAADDERQGDGQHEQAAGGDDQQLDPAERASPPT